MLRYIYTYIHRYIYAYKLLISSKLSTFLVQPSIYTGRPQFLVKKIMDLNFVNVNFVVWFQYTLKGHNF